MSRSLRSLLCLFSLAMAVAAPAAWAQPASAPLTVFAAASLKESLDEATAAYQRASGTPVQVSYAASSALARQV